ncbi:hypothetical protein FK530_22615 [Tsukamurella conjunctivitidis]|uniref:Polysaccharide chain length determinant N-terminal domain-containing protein n=1 Tax=Tsukamurella conjunctivitidis TaxID=2592068 RepID=A0A5C5RTT1_9ACTN|nr:MULTISPECIES: hypothetical protein [Tsukamurella]TWS25631.1 hypothetical protein FK530_22615 [Tsukamurella conjunctivitidis]
MSVAGFVRTILARRLAVLAVLVVTVAAGVFGWSSTSTHYVTNSAVVVIPPGAGNRDAGLNPFVNVASTAQLAYVLATAAERDEARDAVAKAGASPDYQLSTVAGDAANYAQLSPQVTFSVSAPDPEAARRGATALIDFMRDRLQRMQREAGVVDGTFADLRVPVEPTDGAAVSGSALRAAVGYASGGLLGTVLVLLLVGAAADVLRGRRNGEPDADSAVDTDAAVPADAVVADDAADTDDDPPADAEGSARSQPVA